MTIAPLFNMLLGRATAFAIVFTIAGIYLALHGKLTTEFVGLVAAIQALIFAHSVKEDYFETNTPKV